MTTKPPHILIVEARFYPELTDEMARGAIAEIEKAGGTYERMARTALGQPTPSVGILNIGAEEMKGNEDVKGAAEFLRDAELDFDFQGFVEGDDISKGTVDVVVTDGFTGNIALKTAEGTARLIGDYLSSAMALASGDADVRKTAGKPDKINAG